jgi:hypothetical protein
MPNSLQRREVEVYARESCGPMKAKPPTLTLAGREHIALAADSDCRRNALSRSLNRQTMALLDPGIRGMSDKGRNLMAEERDARGGPEGAPEAPPGLPDAGGRAAFDYFMENVNRLLADQHLREVLRELDEGRKETLSLLASDPAAFLRYRGVQIPQDFRVSVKKTSKEEVASNGGGGGRIIICDCVEFCFLGWCSILCYCRIFE